MCRRNVDSWYPAWAATYREAAKQLSRLACRRRSSAQVRMVPFTAPDRDSSSVSGAYGFTARRPLLGGSCGALRSGVMTATQTR